MAHFLLFYLQCLSDHVLKPSTSGTENEAAALVSGQQEAKVKPEAAQILQAGFIVLIKTVAVHHKLFMVFLHSAAF